MRGEERASEREWTENDFLSVSVFIHCFWPSRKQRLVLTDDILNEGWLIDCK